MKRIWLVFSLLCILVSSIQAQDRKAGKAVVPTGFEDLDSIRYGHFELTNFGQWMGDRPNIFDRVSDTAQCNFDVNFAGMDKDAKVYGKRKGVQCYAYPDGVPGIQNPHDLVNYIHQRVYYPAPIGLTNGYRWRYNDLNIPGSGAQWYNVTYDSNDISPYVEYPANHTFVGSSFVTNRFPGHVDSSVNVGDEGRVILGYSDDKFATDLLKTDSNYPFRHDPIHPDIPQLFSATLEFNLDTVVSHIDTVNANGRVTDDLPLLRLQVLYKKGRAGADTVLPGWPMLPFVPFKTVEDTTQPGWWCIVDTVITRSSYRTLSESWRTEDSTDGGGVARPGRRFKQLHVLLNNMPWSMKGLIQGVQNSSLGVAFGGASSPSKRWDGKYLSWRGDTAFMHPAHPDSVVAMDSADVMLDRDLRSLYLLEMRVLSTYRTTTRIRCLTYQDTTVDKFLYRERFGTDSTHSLTPFGKPGGFDDSVSHIFHVWHDSLHIGSTGYVKREIYWNDLEDSWNMDVMPMLGYIDFMAQRFGLHVTHRPQDLHLESLLFRRERIGYDGQPPSVFQNINASNGPWTKRLSWWYEMDDAIPFDYMAYGMAIDTTVPWLQSSLDTTVNFHIERPGPGADSLTAYDFYTAHKSGTWMNPYKNSTASALMHPINKRFALEASIPAYGIFYRQVHGTTGAWIPDSTFDTTNFKGHITITGHRLAPGYLYYRPMTPEEIYKYMYGCLALGYTAFNHAEPFDYGDVVRSAPAVFGATVRTQDTVRAGIRHDYNVGHRYSLRDRTTWWNADSSEQDGPIPPYYMGLSNSYRAICKVLGRINAIYDSTAGRPALHPFKYLRWIGAYSTESVATNPFDSVGYSRAFLHVTKTVPVDRWHRTTTNQYIDLSNSDSAPKTLAMLGFFLDSITTTTRNYACLVLNTRLQPSLRDTEDLNYYNSGVDSISRAKSIYGDIDVRKVYLKLDYAKLPSSFQSKYYVVRDLWHSDSTWLVHRDSTFAIYLKPADAKFLYIEKGVAIDAAKRTGSDSGKADQNDFCFNNGRRIAERMNGSKTVITYTRANKLYVAYPSKGSTVPGYPERTAGDNIATGYEQLLDDIDTCYKPSIAIAQNDVSVALTYWYRDNTGSPNIAFMFQPHPDSAWKRAACPYTTIDFSDTSSDHRYVTPVLTPYNDTTWLIAAGTHGSWHPGIRGLLCTTVEGHDPRWDLVNNDTTFTLAIDKTRPALFPTLASAPAPDTLWPIRMAWQLGDDTIGNDIYHCRVKRLRSVPIVEGRYPVSSGLWACDNKHPSIAMNATEVYSTPFLLPNVYWDDNVTWEALLRREGSHTNYSVIARARHEHQAGWSLPPVGTAWWGVFDVFRPAGGDPTLGPPIYHYPQVTAASRIYTGKFSYNSKQTASTYHDWIRIAWDDQTRPCFASWDKRWLRTSLAEQGVWPSVSNRTDSLIHWTDSTTVRKAVAFASSQTYTPTAPKQVRVTNGLFPFVTLGTYYNHYTIGPPVSAIDPCAVPDADGGIANIWVYPTSPPGPAQEVSWATTDRTGQDYTERFSDAIPSEVHSEAFPIHEGDNIVIPRSWSIHHLNAIQDSMTTGDAITWKMTLRRYVDSSCIVTLDSMFLSKTEVYWAGYSPLIDTVQASGYVPMGWPNDSAFVDVELVRLDTIPNLSRSLIFYNDSGTDVMGAKRANSGAAGTSTLALDIHPNPFNPTTQIDATVIKGTETTVAVYDLLGNEVLSLYSGLPTTGRLSLTLDAKDLASGAYLVRVKSGGQIVTRKVQLVK